MRRLVLVVGAVLICAVLVAVVASTASAQNVPVPVLPPSCENVSRFDHNHDGRLTGADFDLWVWTVHESGRCELNGPLGACPSSVDVNGDGFVSHADLEAMFSFLFQCVYGPRRTQIVP